MTVQITQASTIATQYESMADAESALKKNFADYKNNIVFKNDINTVVNDSGKNTLWILANAVHGCMIVPVGTGKLCAETNADPDYPGVDTEFIPDDENDRMYTRPRILIEKPVRNFPEQTGTLSVMLWTDPQSEDYTDKISICLSDD